MGILGSLRHAWNAFLTLDRRVETPDLGPAYSHRPDRVRTFIATERSMINAIYTRIAIDCSLVNVRHVRLDDQGRYSEDINSGLNECLTVEANIDQGPRHFRRDVVLTMLDRGVMAIVPVDTTINPAISAGFDVKTMRVGWIINWYPRHVRVDVFNEQTGRREQVTLEKKFVSIVENPLYAVMNEPNGTMQRLIRKLNLLDASDDQIASGKLDIIIQLPYVIKSESLRTKAEQRRKDLEAQLAGSQYGIAYADGTEKITQLNRPAENNLQIQVEYLTEMLYGQLGLTKDVMNGTASESAMLNYWNRTIEPILTEMVEAMIRTLLSKTARSQKQSIMFFRDPFRLVPLEKLADIADKFVRNEILTKNEMRGIVGFKPVKDPEADKLQNPNMPDPSPIVPSPSGSDLNSVKEGDSQNGS